MIFSFSTEVTSSFIKSDNPLYQRTLKAYELISNYSLGDVLEIGSGEGYAIDIFKKNTKSLTLIDKSKNRLKKIKEKYPDVITIREKAPPLLCLNDNTFDSIISFQVIEHIKDYNAFIKEIHRVLKPGGKAYITTPNKHKTIARNPWHYKEFSIEELNEIFFNSFKDVSIKGIEGNDITEQYDTKNVKNVTNILKLDFLKIHEKLPSWTLMIPYEVLNRINRLRLYKSDKKLVYSITTQDYNLQPYSDKTLDLFCVLKK
jgi:SAM-dependent methyltransferase